MSLKQIASFADAAGTIVADTNASANSIVLRDASGGVTNASSTAASQVSTATETGAVHATSTGTTSVDSSATHWPCDATSGAFTITLPAVSANIGRRLSFKKIDSSGNAVTVHGNGSENIDGANTFALTAQWNHLTLIGTATGWHIVG